MSKFWNIEQTASYNCLFNFIDGIRGAGKTYGLLKYEIERYKKFGYRFMYVRRSEEELKTLTTQKSGRLFKTTTNLPGSPVSRIRNWTPDRHEWFRKQSSVI